MNRLLYVFACISQFKFWFRIALSVLDYQSLAKKSCENYSLLSSTSNVTAEEVY